MSYEKRFAMVSAVAAAVASAAPVGAATYTWTPTAASTSYNWINSGQDNWGTGTGGAYPSNAGDVANINGNVAAQTIRLSTAVTLGTLNIGDSDGGSAITINNFSASGTATPANTLTFESNSPGGATALNIGATGTVTNTISASVLLGGTSPLTISRGGTQNLTLSGGVTTGANVLTVSGPGTGTVSITGDLVGTSAGKVVQSATGSSLTLGSTVKSFTGTYQIDAGALTMISGSGKNSAKMDVSGYWSSGAAAVVGGSIVVGNNSGQSTVPEQRLSSTAVTLRGGYLNNGGQALSGAAIGQTVTETIGTFRFENAYSMVNIGQGGNSAGTTMTATSLQRAQGATTSVRGNSLSGTQKFLVTNPLPAGVLLGDGGSAGSYTMSIVPWMTASNGNASAASPIDFGTYVAGSGFRSLVSAEQDGTLAGTSGRNVAVGSVALAADQSVNSLKYTTSGSTNIGAGRILTISSGGLAFALSGTIGAPGNASAGTLNFGSAEAVIWAIGANTSTIGSTMAGSGGLTKAGTGTLTLAGPNNITGVTHVAAGTLRVGNGTEGSTLGDDDVFVHQGAILDILSAGVIEDDDMLALLSTGVHNGQANIGSGLVETVGALSLGGALQGAGYYGSSAAYAANPLLQPLITVNDTYFTGAGLVQVVPEPATLSFLALGALMAGRRKRS